MNADNSIFSRSRMKTFPRHLGTHVYALRCLSSWSAEFTVSRKFPRTSKKSQCTASCRVHSTVLSRTSLHPCSSPTFNFPTICPVNLPGIRVSFSLPLSLRSFRSPSSRDYAIKVARMIIETRIRAYRSSSQNCVTAVSSFSSLALIFVNGRNSLGVYASNQQGFA